MKVAHFECIGGVGGDMILAAFLDAGVELDELRRGLEKLQVPGFGLEAERVQRQSLAATQVRVLTQESPTHRHLGDIERIVDASQLSEIVRDRAKTAFRRLAEAEARVHGITPEQVHFHEVGALDAIVDVVGAMLCVSILGIDRVTISPFRLGRGTVTMEHGTFPLPAPATLELLRGWPVEFTSLPFELTTPTGAAVLITLAGQPQPPPAFRVLATGYGAGSRDLSEVPNVLRLTVGQEEVPLSEDRAVVVEANIDDMNPELYPNLIERLFEAGAMDVVVIPALMKKGRPAATVQALAPLGQQEPVVRTFFRESTTIGVRMHAVERRKLARRLVEVETSLGRVKAKEIRSDEGDRLVPEYEECRRLAREKNLSLRDVYARLSAELSHRS